MPTVHARNIYLAQPVDVITKLYQHLAKGSLQLIGESYPVTVNASISGSTVIPTSFGPEAGPTYVMALKFVWRDPAPPSTTVQGWIEVAYQNYRTSILGSSLTFPDGPNCVSVYLPIVLPSTTTGTVNSILHYNLYRFPTNVTVFARWDGTVIGSGVTDFNGQAVGDLRIPAAQMGSHTLQWRYGTWMTMIDYIVKPRIKLIPDAAPRGNTVNISLRGYAAHETVRIRWKRGSSWVQIATVATSSTGSANIDVTVPTWVPNGLTSVRGDSVNSTGGRAQTNVFKVVGGPYTGSAIQTPTQTPTPPPSLAATTAPSESPTIEPTATDTPTPEPTSTPRIETLTPDPTTIPEASPVA